MTKTVFQAINAVQEELSKIGIAKAQKNQQQRYNFRGIDDIYNTLAPLLAKHRLVIMPKALEREVVERTTMKGSVLFYVTVKVDYHFISADDASEFVVTAFGEAMDSGDKATNKAMSSAYKYAAFQAFCIPTEGDNDADATTHEVEGKKPVEKPKQKPEPKPNPDELENWAEELSLAQTLEELKSVWAKLPANAKPTLTNIKNQRKTTLEEQG